MKYWVKALAQSLVLSANGGDSVDGDVDRTEHKAGNIGTTVEKEKMKLQMGAPASGKTWR